MAKFILGHFVTRLSNSLCDSGLYFGHVLLLIRYPNTTDVIRKLFPHNDHLQIDACRRVNPNIHTQKCCLHNFSRRTKIQLVVLKNKILMPKNSKTLR